MTLRLQSGQAGELVAERWFSEHGWHMIRTQPPMTILGIVTPGMASVIRRFIPRLADWGHMVIARMGKGGVSDYTGYEYHEGYWNDKGMPLYRACEVKECRGYVMPASRLDKDQRLFMSRLPDGCAWVGIFWIETQRFTMHLFQEKGSYSNPITKK